jgi:hypothetical protein
MSDLVKIPEDRAISDAISGLGEIAQKALTRTVWKDGIDIEEPSFDAKMFAKWIAEPYLERIAQQDAELKRTKEALDGLCTAHADLGQKACELEATVETLKGVLQAASHALHSYQYGKASTELARSTADKIDQQLPPKGEQG